jgi:hypothetical protein
VNWKFVIKTGEMFDPSGKKVWTGYAGGNCGHNPEGRNNPLMVSVHNIGPLPPGLYTLGEVVLQSHLGPYAIPLIPDPQNVMFGRKDFYCHGDTTPSGNASEGCIIMPRFVREVMYEGHVRTIQVVAQ